MGLVDLSHLSRCDLDVLAIGEIIVDLISVEESESMRDAAVFRRYQGGAPANLAANVAQLGGRAGVIAKVGTGAFGQFLEDELARAGVVTDYLIRDPAVHSSVIFMTRSPGTADSIAYRDGDYQLRPQEVEEAVIARAKIVHASAFALAYEPCRSAIEKAFQLAQSLGKIISFDPNFNPAVWPNKGEAMPVLQRLFANATISKPSLDDAERLFGPGKSIDSYIKLYHALGPEVVVFTMGAGGSVLSTPDSRIHIPARPITVADATGAGDAFWAGFLVSLLDGRPLSNCVLFGREMAERKLSTVGALPGKIDRQSIYEIIDNSSSRLSDAANGMGGR